jgi:hypothetical protein
MMILEVSLDVKALSGCTSKYLLRYRAKNFSSFITFPPPPHIYPNNDAYFVINPYLWLHGADLNMVRDKLPLNSNKLSCSIT